jgi:hypothetical protein
VAVAWPLSPDALAAPLEAARLGLIEPVLIGPTGAITALAREHRLALGRHRIVEAADPQQAATTAVRMAGAGEARALMKGSLHTDELMSAVVAREGGLRTSRRISHVFAMGVPTHDRLLLVTDAAVNIAPDLEAKADIVRNAIDLAHALGIGRPRVALLAAVETVNPRMAATVDAAALCKMADRGQITGGVLDGPLAFDNALRGRRSPGHPGRTRSRGGQHPVQAAGALLRRVRRRSGARGAGAGDPDQPRGQPRIAGGLVRDRAALRPACRPRMLSP